MSTWKYYDAGIGNVASYQASGHPWMSGSTLAGNEEVQISFPYVTKSITIAQSGSGLLRIHFADTGSMNPSPESDGCLWELNTTEDALTMNIKCSNVWLSNGHGSTATGYQIFAELTRIDTGRMWALTGSGISE